MWQDVAWGGAHILARRASDVSTSKEAIRCPSYKLPAHGIIELAPGNFITLNTDGYFRPQCNNVQFNEGTGGIQSISDTRDPFHASITPQAYATGAATVIAWMLVIMLIITPRTFFVGNATGRSGLMGRRGMISGATGSGSIIGVGSRPWLQKVAALTVAISLTLATADTFKIAGRQYTEGFIDALELRNQVVIGMEIKVSRVISDIFLWLAQVQTLIRLFPRHKEKVIIKWVGFALILLDIAFSSLNSFGPYEHEHTPARFHTAIPALSYLFQLSLSMLYAAWVIYYSITKRRYAFYHSMMWNMTVVALLSIVAIFTPVVFFITDIANDSIAGWGDYFRWVGAAAASVIVWEWVERIEALEREERKDGILGREIYDGDDMLATTPDSNWPTKSRSKASEKEQKKGGDDGPSGFTALTLGHAGRFSELAQRVGRKMTESPRTQARHKRTLHIPAPAPVHRRSEPATGGEHSVSSPPPVPVISSPVSRTETTSADSTVYTVRYHPINGTPPGRQPSAIGTGITNGPVSLPSQRESQILDLPTDTQDPEKGVVVESETPQSKHKRHWQAVANSFRRHGRTPPQELQRGRVIEPLAVDDVIDNIPPRNYEGLALADRLGTFAAQQGERFRRKKKSGEQFEATLPVTIIPAQPRGQTWSPDIITQQQQVQHEELPAAAGVQLARMPTAMMEEEDGMSPMRSGATSSSEEIGQPSPPTSTSTHNSRVHFVTDTIHLTGGRSDSNDLAFSPQSGPGILGAQVRTPPLRIQSVIGTEITVPSQHTRTDHDR